MPNLISPPIPEQKVTSGKSQTPPIIAPTTEETNKAGANRVTETIVSTGSTDSTEVHNVEVPLEESNNRISEKYNNNEAVDHENTDSPVSNSQIEETQIEESKQEINKTQVQLPIVDTLKIDNQEQRDEPAVQVAEPQLKTKTDKPDVVKKVQLDLASKRVSALSISSLKAKREHRLSKKDVKIDESQLPNAPFTQEDMQKHWADFVAKIDADGRKILASSLTTDIPKMFDETTIWIELPNDTMKKEVEREQYDLLVYLKQQLDNHFISLRITVNEATAKKFAFTPEEKYQKLREKNPAIDLLRQTFDLDL